MQFRPVRASRRRHHQDVINCLPCPLPPRPTRLRRSALAIGLLAAQAMPLAAQAPAAEPGSPLTEAVRGEVLRMTQDALEGAQAFEDRRAPRYEGR